MLATASALYDWSTVASHVPVANPSIHRHAKDTTRFFLFTRGIVGLRIGLTAPGFAEDSLLLPVWLHRCWIGSPALFARQSGRGERKAQPISRAEGAS